MYVYIYIYIYIYIYTKELFNTNNKIQTSLQQKTANFDVLLTVHLSIFISVINQLDGQKFCFTIRLFHASTCFEHMCSLSGGQNCITQPLVSSHLQVAVSCTRWDGWYGWDGWNGSMDGWNWLQNYHAAEGHVHCSLFSYTEYDCWETQLASHKPDNCQ